MKYILTLITFLVMSGSAHSQKITKKKIRCYTVQQIKKIKANNPNIQTDQQFELWLNPLVKLHKQKTTSNQYKVPVLNYTLPVVFHVITNGEAVGSGNNITAARIQAQVLQLNKDYANLSGSPYSVSANTGIQFALATKDPNGNTLAEAGIERISRSTKGWTAPPFTTDYIDATIKPGSYWDATRYLNIWLVDMSGDGILGFATFPSTSTLSGLDNTETATTAGLAIDPTTVGSIFSSTACGSTTNPYTLGKTLTHEMGHFLGLRHIWGDQDPAPCSDDYCGDTPLHYDANYGKPSHPKANSCGTADEMFENYMDYTDDDILNTFTADQVDRMQTVLLNSPRRKTLPTSTVGFTYPTGSNKVGFAICSGAISTTETGNAGTTSRYRDIPLVLNVENVATGNATINFSTSGTAVNNVDYQLSATSVSFVANDAAKSINLRVIDNATNDGNKTVTISYTIAGTGVVANTTSQSITITIVDDEFTVISNSSTTLFSNNFGSNTSVWSTLSDGGRNKFTISSNGSAGGTGACAHITSNTTSKPNTYNVDSASVAILRTPLIDATGYKNVTASYKYSVWGETYQNVIYDYGQFVYFKESAPTSVAGTLSGQYSAPETAIAAISGSETINNLTALTGISKFYLGFYWENDNGFGDAPGLNIDDVAITADATKVETGLSNSYTYTVGTSASNSYFKSTSNDYIIATLKSLAATGSGITASITEAGTDRVNITSGANTYLRSRKVIQITPTATDNTTQYTATIYFTTAEVASWPSATSLKVLKIKSGTATSDNLNSSNSTLITPTVDDKRTANGYIAYSFAATGFGSFVIVDGATVLPVSLLSFDATAETSSVKLAWSTTNEVNSVGFDVQRSTNTTAFTTIGFVASKSGTVNNYTFNDGLVVNATKYYYRLLQKDADGKTGLSNVVSVVFNGASSTVRVTPNPFTNFITVQYHVATTPISVVVVDVLGKKLYEIKSSGLIKINTEQWSKGGYFIQINDGNSIQNYKVIKN